MVYCGKPSGSCHACRERKTRCDQIPTGCTQCKRVKRICPGYRVLGDLIFRNESKSVVRKAKAQEKKLRIKELELEGTGKGKEREGGSKSSSPEDGDADWEDLEVVQKEDSSLSVFSLAPTLEDRATNFFVANYVLGMDGPSKGYLDYLVNISHDEIMDESLVFSMRAVGLAGFAHTNHSPSLLRNARYQYLKAIQETNRALRDPVDVKKDSTLLAIMILGIFEAITGVGRKSIKDWEEHLLGAAAVIKLRGPSQVYTPAGRRMLVQATSTLIISCIRRSTPLPPHIEQYIAIAFAQIKGKPDPALLVYQTLIEFCSFRYQALSNKLTDPHQILLQALAMDDKLISIQDPVPPGWEYETVYTDVENVFVWRGKYHVYYDYWIAQIWNALRTMRIMLNETIRSTLLAGFSEKPPVFTEPYYFLRLENSTKILYEQQEAILLSVPQHVGCFPSVKPFESKRKPDWASTQIDDQSCKPTIKQSGGSFLIWPLLLAGMMDVATDEVKTFTAKILRGVGERMGIEQAFILAEAIEKGEDLPYWIERRTAATPFVIRTSPLSR